MNILIVEDEPPILQAVAACCREQGYTIEVAETYCLAEEKLHLYEYDCLIVDIMLPDGNGLELIRKVKEHASTMGVIVISALGAITDKVEALNIGADDYLTKPFSFAELNARVYAVIRRRRFAGQNEYSFNEITVHSDARRVFVGEREIVLTRKEYDMLIYFLTNRERVITKECIVEHLWGDTMGLSADSFDFIYTHIRNLRKKMVEAGAHDYIKTIYAVGYKFTSEEL
ncbi:MAG: response regulator transcription factor [Alistipes sp.]